MSLSLKFFCFTIILGVAGLFVLKKPDGTPWLALNDFIFDTSSAKDLIDDITPNSIRRPDEVVVYRWQDAEGNWQFSDKPASDSTVEQVTVSTHLNRDLVPEQEKTVDESPKEDRSKALLIKDSSIPPTTPSLDKTSKLIRDAQNIQNLVDEHKKLQNKALGK